VPTINERLDVMTEHPPLAMQFRGTTADECRKWQAEFAAKLRSLLGPYQPPEQWSASKIDSHTIAFDDHTREEWVLTADGVPPVPLYLLVPKSASTNHKTPGILALHGHGQFGHDPVAGVDNTPELKAAIADANYDYGRQLVRRRYVVVAPCFTPFGRRLGKPGGLRTDACTQAYLRLQYFGKLLIAENLRDALWSLEFLAQHAAVDPERLACVGLSYGGRMTMLTSALSPRIRAAVVSGAMNCFQERTRSIAVSGCQIIPGLLEYGDVPEIGSLIAPRPCVWEAGLQDSLMKQPWCDEIGARLRRAYTALGAESNLHVDRFEGRHEWHGEVAYPVLRAALGSA
jgi:dienelactone hydrolase